MYWSHKLDFIQARCIPSFCHKTSPRALIQHAQLDKQYWVVTLQQHIITQTKPSLGFLMGSANGTDHKHLWVAERIENLDLERCSFLWKVFERQHFVWIVLVRQSHLTFFLARCWTFTNGSMGYRTRRPNFYQA